MKKCLGCGYDCNDSDNVCPRCGTKLSGNVIADILEQVFNIVFKSSKEHSKNVDSTIEVNTNNNTQKSVFSNVISHNNDGNNVFNLLWVIFSFIPFINGFGIFLAGKKTSKKSWILEGVLYEIPVIFHLVLGSSFITFSLVVLSLIVSIARSVMIITEYKSILNESNYKKVDNKFLSLLMFISSFIPFLNGVGFIYLGNKYSKLYLIIGYLFELVWLIVILLINILPFTLKNLGMLIGLAISSLIASGMTMISFNYDCDALYHYVNNSQYNVTGNNKRLYKDMYNHYEKQLNNLKDVFDAKEKKVRKLIKERFGTGNLTSNRFLSVVDNSHENVYNLYNSGLDLINYTSEPSQQVEEELIERVNKINSINEEMEKLTVELILNIHEDEKSDDKIQNLVNDMENLINDINKYE
ncbi:MAG: zinc ribbon domain-containing protein [Methanosphaera stadtmanae]|nr:zinc ribbon domain-containing protein [Methanosphaera stadtmanae]